MPSKPEELRNRTAAFAVDVLKFCRTLPASEEGRRISHQLGDAATSVAANYRAVCRVRTRPEFLAKIRLVLEEADEACYWLGLALKMKLASPTVMEPLCREAEELTRIFSASVRTARSRG